MTITTDYDYNVNIVKDSDRTLTHSLCSGVYSLWHEGGGRGYMRKATSSAIR